LLIVFAISITPAIIFHNWLAPHTDTYKSYGNTKGLQLGKQTFNCQVGHFVAESPFTEPVKAIIIYPLQFLNTPKAEIPVQPVQETQFLYALRGPPAV
jgi:hypothetical protein